MALKVLHNTHRRLHAVVFVPVTHAAAITLASLTFSGLLKGACEVPIRGKAVDRCTVLQDVSAQDRYKRLKT